VNTQGSYRCQCNIGFEGDGLTCRGKWSQGLFQTLLMRDNNRSSLQCIQVFLKWTNVHVWSMF